MRPYALLINCAIGFGAFPFHIAYIKSGSHVGIITLTINLIHCTFNKDTRITLIYKRSAGFCLLYFMERTPTKCVLDFSLEKVIVKETREAYRKVWTMFTHG